MVWIVAERAWLRVRRTHPVSVLQHDLSDRRGLASAGSSRGRSLGPPGRRWGLLELAIVLSMQMLGGDPQAAYLLGLAGIGYALGLAWHRARSTQENPTARNRRSSRVWKSVAWVVFALVVWCVVTLVLGSVVPEVASSPASRHRLCSGWCGCPGLWPRSGGWLALGFLVYWWKRGWRSPLGFTWLGLAASAALSCALTAAQLLPVIEFTQRTSRAAEGGTHDIYPFSIEPFRLLEIAWPNILGNAVRRATTTGAR